MISVFDIGNTNITFGVFDGKKLRFSARLSTDRQRTSEQYAIEINTLTELNGLSAKDITGSIVSSVVPELTFIIKRAVKFLTGVSSMVLGPGVKSGLNIKIDNPAQLGADLVAGAVGAAAKYPLPCLVLDLGTATKISVLDETGAYRGCVIAAGVSVSMKALAGSASLLSTIDITADDCPAFGTNTTDSMRAGVILGTAAMLDGMCDRIEESLGVSAKTVVATGGLAGLVVSHCRREVVYDPGLLLEGLRIIYEKNTEH